MLTDTEGIWEVRVQLGSDIFRILSFFDGPQLVVLTNGFAKKTQKVPRQEIEAAQKRRKDYFERRK
jgi:phage-related protein